jgi:hypothetical protein
MTPAYISSLKSQKIACFGSRETPVAVLTIMEKLAQKLSYQQHCLIASGHCQGADLAFEAGAAPERMIVCLPWSSYNKNIPINSSSQIWVLASMPQKDQLHYFEVAKKYHPVWDSLSSGVKLLHGRNILIGQDASFGICYINHKKPGCGGSGQCYRYLSGKAPVLDLSLPAHLKIAHDYLVQE